MNAVIYARYSSSNQREESIAGQLRECRRYADANGFTIIKEYTDSALTGKTDKRPAFQQMIKDSENGAFQAVIVWKLDRFARNRYDAAMYRHKLTKNGVRIYSAMENISDSPEGIILEGLMESLAEYYSANLAENVKRGLYDSALEFKVLSQPTYGYKRGENGRYEIDEYTAPIVARIFNEYASGKPYMQIVDDLNKDGLRTAQGKPFNKNSLRNILRNEKYIGVYRYKDIYAPNAIPAIVSRELFDSVQAEIKKRSFTRKRKAPEGGELYLLAGKLFCGHCGEHMTGESVRSKSGETYKYYTCNGQKTAFRNGCKKKRVPKHWIETEIIKIVNNEILTDEFIDTLAARVVEYQAQEHENTTLKILRQEQAATDKKLNNIMAAIEAGIWSETTQARLTELESRKTQLEADIARESVAETQFTAEQITAFLRAVRSANKTSTGMQSYLIDKCINKIYLFDDPNEPDAQRVVIDINYGGNKTASFDSVIRFTHMHPCLQTIKRTLTESGACIVYLSIKKRTA